MGESWRGARRRPPATRVFLGLLLAAAAAGRATAEPASTGAAGAEGASTSSDWAAGALAAFGLQAAARADAVAGADAATLTNAAQGEQASAAAAAADAAAGSDVAQAAEAAGATDATAHATTVAGAESGGDVAAGARVLALDATAVLRLHNRYRAMHAAPPLSWGGDLAGSAARYAAKCVWKHSEAWERSGSGENLYFCRGCRSGEVPVRGVRIWYDEHSDYDYRTGQAYPNKRGSMVGHFTQVVWRGTARVGCAAAQCPWLSGVGGDTRNAVYVVCRYDPPGNLVYEDWSKRYSMYPANVKAKQGRLLKSLHTGAARGAA